MVVKAWSRRKFLLASTSWVAFPGPGGVTVKHERITDVTNRLQDRRPMTWVFTGDSVTQGALHTYGHRSYSERFAEHIRWVMKRYDDIVINSGVNGTTAAYLAGQFDWFVTRFQPDVVFLMYGINDCVDSGKSDEDFGKELKLLVENVRTIGAIPILQTPNGIDFLGIKAMKTGSRARLPIYVDKIRTVAKRESVQLIDHFRYWGKHLHEMQNGWLDDPLHPSAEGHTQLANRIINKLKMAGQS